MEKSNKDIYLAVDNSMEKNTIIDFDKIKKLKMAVNNKIKLSNKNIDIDSLSNMLCPDCFIIMANLLEE